MKKSHALSLLLLTLTLGACARKAPLVSSAEVTVLSSSEMPPPEAADVSNVSRPYLIGPYDKLRIDVFGMPELSQRTVQVDSAGRLAFPFSGSIDATGKTPAQVGTEITAALRRAYIRDPQVTVNLEQAVSQVVTVDGEVREPGLYPVVGRMTLMRAVATAKGLGEDADDEDVVIFRTVGARKYAAAYNLQAIRRGAYGDPEVFANDVVVVGKSSFSGAFKSIVAAAPLITTPLLLLIR
jgi:polysaccharide export outer membrane protein